MSLLNTVAVNEANGSVKEIYDGISGALGFVPNVLQLLSVDPKLLELQWSLVQNIFSMPKENQHYYLLLEYLMSEENECDNCITLLKGMLINMFGMTNEQILEIKKNPASAPLTKNNIDLLLFTIKAVNHAKDVDSNDIKKLEAHGFTQKEIFNSVRIAGHMFMLNTLFRTFKVKQES